MKADDVEGALTKVIAPGYITNLDHFVSQLKKDESFTPHGKMLHAFNVTPCKFFFSFPGFLLLKQKINIHKIKFPRNIFILVSHIKLTFHKYYG